MEYHIWNGARKRKILLLQFVRAAVTVRTILNAPDKRLISPDEETSSLVPLGVTASTSSTNLTANFKKPQTRVVLAMQRSPAEKAS